MFLSYASQDADAARRIADALRGAGVEVWFDQSELVGGDAWDQKIRKQIRECALFVPIISANTQARTEGYFRLEWRLADQRTHLMAKGRPFLLPVVIDATRDAEAHVPDSFSEVQWTRLAGGETPAAFSERVKKLLGNTEVEAGRPRPAERGVAVLPPGKSKRWLVPAVTMAAVALALAFWHPWKKSAPVPTGAQPSTLAQPVAQQSEARKLAMQAQALIDDPNFTRENYQLADELCQRALALDASDAEVWAVAAFVSEDMITESYDESAQRQGLARTQSERAVRLDPQSIRAGLAVAKNLRLSGDLPECIRRLRELEQRAPTDRLVLRELARSERKMGNDAGVQEVLTRLQALPGGDPRTLVTEAKNLRNRGRLPEAEALDDQLLATTPVRLAYYEKLLVLARGWSDLAAATAFMEKIPAELQHEDAFGSLIAQIWIWQGKGDKALEALDKVPHDYLEEFAARGPKAYLTGWAQRVAGRPTAAQAEWQGALDLTETRLTADRMNLRLLEMKAGLEALLGRKDAARSTWKLRVELGGTVNQAGLLEAVGLPVLLGETEEAIAVLQRRWAAMDAGLRGWYFSNLRYAPEFAPIRDDPRVQQIITEQVAALEVLRHPKTAGKTALRESDTKSVAVLAFDNLSDDKANEYFSDGLSENILDKLARNPGLRVMARTSSFSYKGRNVPIAQIAQELHVGTIIEGSVQRAGPRLRVTAQLVNAADGTQVWSETYDRELTDIFAVQDEIALKIAARLAPGVASAQPEQRPTANLDAYDAYLRGLEVERQGVGNNLMARAVPYYEEAVRLDPGFALAWARLAHALAWFYWGGGLPGGDELTRARQALAEAVRLQPALPQIHWARAAILRADGVHLDEAARELERAESNQPANADTFLERAMVARFAGRLDDALDLCHRAAERDPRNPIIFNTSGLILIYLGRYPEALAAFDQCTKLGFGSSPRENKAIVVLRTTGDAVAALREFDSIAPNEVDDEVRVNKVDFLEAAGDYAGALANIDRIEKPAFLMQWGYTVRALMTARVREAMGDAGGAQRDYRDALPLVLEYQRKNPESWRAYPALTLAYAGLGKKGEAMAATQAALKLVPPAENPYYAQLATLPVQVEVLARFGLIDEALAIVREEIVAGWWRRNDLLHLPSFLIIRKDSRFRAIAEKAPL